MLTSNIRPLSVACRWGNPAKPEFYQYMKSYSPMDNVQPTCYPHMLFTGGLHDPRVAYWEPAKMVARLRAEAEPGGLVLLKMEMGAG
jgi:oligopeptidase B